MRFRMRRDIGARWQERQNDRTGGKQVETSSAFFACFFHESSIIWNAEEASKRMKRYAATWVGILSSLLR